MGPWVSAGTASPAVGLCCRPCGYCGKQDGRGLLLWSLYSFFFLRFYLLIFREGKGEGEKHQCVVASCTPSAGDLPATQACALIGN